MDAWLSRHQIDDRGALLWINSRGHHAGRLVEQVVHEVWTQTQKHAIDRDPVAVEVDTSTEHDDPVVDGDPAFLDELLRRPSAPEARAGQHLLQTLTIWQLDHVWRLNPQLAGGVGDQSQL